MSRYDWADPVLVVFVTRARLLPAIVRTAPLVLEMEEQALTEGNLTQP
jgi:hypothetical protein